MQEKNYIKVTPTDIKNIEGKLLTLIESSPLSDRQCDGMKGTIRTLLWEWHDSINNRVSPTQNNSDYEQLWRGMSLKTALQNQQAYTLTGYSYSELVKIVSDEGNEDNLEQEEVKSVDESVNMLQHMFDYFSK